LAPADHAGFDSISSTKAHEATRRTHLAFFVRFVAKDRHFGTVRLKHGSKLKSATLMSFHAAAGT
jgi:hypothetical protein